MDCVYLRLRVDKTHQQNIPAPTIIILALMSNKSISRSNTRAIREYVVSKRLRRRFEELGVDTVRGDEDASYDERFSWEKSLTEFEPRTEELNNVIEDSRAWLEGLAVKEEIRASLLIANMGHSACEMYRKEAQQLQSAEPGIDTTILERICKDEELHDKVFEDLLAPLRIRELPYGTEELQESMIKVLLDWNKQITQHVEEDVEGRQAFIAALEERIKTVDKVLAIVGDETNIDQFDKIGQNGILEPSQRRLLKAIRAYRPETREFWNQNPFDMLVIMWAHLQDPGLTAEDDWMYLSYKVLNGEKELEICFDREEEWRSFREVKKDAMQEGDQDEALRCTKRWKAYNKKIADLARQHTISRIHYARGELRRIELDGLLNLSILQSAQQCVARDALPEGWTPPWTQILERYATADAKLDERLERCFPDLEATSEVTANQVQEMATIHDMVLTRTLKFAGVDVAGMKGAAKERLVEAWLADPVTSGMMEQRLYGVLETQVVATQMLRHLSVMEKSLGELLEAAKAKCEQVEKLTLVADCDERLGSRGDVEAEFA